MRQSVDSKQNGPYIKGSGFEYIFLLRIFWSSSSLNATFNGKSVNRGIWAGNCLEMATLDRHAKSMPSDAAWKDISKDVTEDITQLFSRLLTHLFCVDSSSVSLTGDV